MHVILEIISHEPLSEYTTDNLRLAALDLRKQAAECLSWNPSRRIDMLQMARTVDAEIAMRSA